MALKLDRYSRGWTGRSYIKRQTIKQERQAVKLLLANGRDLPKGVIRKPKGYCD